MKKLGSIKRQVLILLAAIFVCAGAGFSFAMGETLKESDLSGFQKSSERCSNKNVLLSLGKVKINALREHLNIRLKSGKLLYPSAIKNDCSINEIGNVASVIIPFSGFTKSVLQVELSDIDITRKDVTSYDIGYIEKYPERAKNILSDKLTGDERFYRLPLEQVPTANNQPAIIFCGENNPKNKTSFCNTSYFLPQGPRISYRFFRKDVPVSEYLNFDKKIRQKLSQMITE